MYTFFFEYSTNLDIFSWKTETLLRQIVPISVLLLYISKYKGVIQHLVRLAFFQKSSLLDVWLGTEYPSGKKLFNVLTLKDPIISESCIEIKIELNFYFHTSLWCLKRFYEGLKGLHKTFSGTTKKCENKNLT